MSSPAYLSGITGSVELTPSGGSAAAYRFDKWKLAIKSNLPKVTNFLSSGFQEVIKGITSGTITCSGPYDTGNMPVTAGNTYLFTLAWNNSVNITVTATVESVELDDDANDAARVSITAQSTGSFTASIV